VASTTRFIRGECVTVQVGKGERKDVRSPSGCCDSDPFHSNRVGLGGFRVPASSTPPVDLHEIKQMHPLRRPIHLHRRLRHCRIGSRPGLTSTAGVRD
jgi:hypothetical protein